MKKKVHFLLPNVQKSHLKLNKTPHPYKMKDCKMKTNSSRKNVKKKLNFTRKVISYL